MVRTTPRPYRRSAFQVAVLMFVTGGLYVFVWAFHVRRYCAALLERDDQPLWKSIALVIPIFNLFLMFDLGKMIEGVNWRADPERPQSNVLPWLGLATFFVGALWRIPNAFWMLSLLDFVPLSILHLSFTRGQLAASGEAAVATRLHWIERTVIAVGAVFWCLAFVGMTVSDEHGRRDPFWWMSFVVVALAITTFALIHRADAAVRSDGLALHARQNLLQRVEPGRPIS
jgi:hypothetical protein